MPGASAILKQTCYVNRRKQISLSQQKERAENACCHTILGLANIRVVCGSCNDTGMKQTNTHKTLHAQLPHCALIITAMHLVTGDCTFTMVVQSTTIVILQVIHCFPLVHMNQG